MMWMNNMPDACVLKHMALSADGEQLEFEIGVVNERVLHSSSPTVIILSLETEMKLLVLATLEFVAPHMFLDTVF